MDIRQDLFPAEAFLAADRSIGSWLQSLTSETAVNGLPTFDVTVHPEVLTNIVDRQLGAAPHLPGVVVASGDQLIGMISRGALLAHLSRPFGQELYLKRPIRLLLEAETRTPLVIPDSLKVGDAAHHALQRPQDCVYEPVVVSGQEGFRLLDVHTLLIAQSRLLELANETIRQQADTSEAANHAKSLFLANMSHEIRTPLTAILGFTENLLDPKCTVDERTVYSETILRNGHHLLNLINEILDLSKIEADRLEIERLSFCPGEIIADVISALQLRAESKQVGLSIQYDGPIPETIIGDPTRLRQVLMNVVSNGIKFTEKGEVTVRVRMVDANGEVCVPGHEYPAIHFECDVIDTGIGMSNDQLSRLFSPFMQADESTARRFGGTGLGLAISRRLVRLMGGDIRVQSQPNVGSTFSIHFPTDSLPNTPWRDCPSSIVERSWSPVSSLPIELPLKILLAEDGPDNQLLIGTFLKKLGADVSIVSNGQSAVDLALKSLLEGRPFEIVLMDMHMPVMDGYSAARKLRSHGWTNPILALTANVMQGDRQKCLEAGCDDFAPKPIRRSELIDQIQKLTSKERSPSIIETSQRNVRHVNERSDTQFNQSVALERVGGDQDLLREVAELFVRVVPEWMDEMERGLTQHDTVTVRRLAHSLKNSADNIGGEPARVAMMTVEQVAADGDLERVKSIWPESRASFLLLLDAVKRFID